MTEQRPTDRADIAGLATERRRALLYAALNDAGAAEAGLLRLVAYIAALAVLWAGGIADEPPPTEAEKRAGFGFVADVVEDDGSYDD